ncbi:MerR family transcriptional regulator, partial [Nocardia sp. NPDC003246]
VSGAMRELTGAIADFPAERATESPDDGPNGSDRS